MELLELLGYEQEPNSIYEIRICVLQLLFILYLGRILLLLNHGFEFHFACLKCIKFAFPPTIILIESIESFLGFHNRLHFDLLLLEYLHAYSFDEQFNVFVFHTLTNFPYSFCLSSYIASIHFQDLVAVDKDRFSHTIVVTFVSL